jgi:FkbM family methyltransferase
MTPKNIINKLMKPFGLKLSRVPNHFSNRISYHIPKDHYKINRDYIFLKNLNIKIAHDYSNPLITGYYDALRIVQQLNGSFYYNDNRLRVRINDINLNINNGEELFIINEIFTEGSYNVLNTNDHSIFIDIGMHVGTASLFFASKDNIGKCYSFELFPQTYEAAINNINLNVFGHKVIAHDYGLGKEEKTLTLPYSRKMKCMMGINGLPKDDIPEDYIAQDVIVKDVGLVLRNIADENSNKFIICKIDCEGAEYEIIERLQASDTLSVVDIYMIEWHYIKPETIIKSLMEKNYVVFYSTFKSDDSGLLYALKKPDN